MNSKIDVILPIFNEERFLTNVLTFLTKLTFVNRIIVVDDGSTDRSLEICKAFNLQVVSIKRNVGKTQAVIEGIKHSEAQLILLMDGDLKGLNILDFDNMLVGIEKGYDMVILNYGGTHYPFSDRFTMFPALSGVRIIRKSEFMKVPFNESDRFELERRVNRYYIGKGLKILVIDSKTLKTPDKWVKYGLFTGVYLHLKAGFQIFLSDGIGGYVELMKDRKYLRSLVKSNVN